MRKAAPATVIRLSEAQARQAHAMLAGHGPDLSRAVEETRLTAASGPVAWSAPVTTQTTHRLCGLQSAAAEAGAQLLLEDPVGLDEREQAVLTDFQVHGPTASARRGPRLRRRADEAIAAAGEAWFALSGALGRLGPRKPGPMRRAMVIGAYGGDHVGDAAILGGVLLRLNEALGVTHVDVMSHRPDHTRRLAAGLATPVRCNVWPYDPNTARARLRDADALVIAGGPLMDLPRVLAMHLGTAHRARALGVPLFIERVGIGPFRRKASRWAARRLLTFAERISLRTSGSALDPVMEGVAHTVGRDPAFDYLATRVALDRRTPGATRSADALLEGTAGRILVGVNIRPIYHGWSRSGEAFSRAAEDRFNAALAEGMGRFAALSDRPVTYVFFPMNPIYFGKSDLEAAWRLHKAVGRAADLRVWEADPDVDDVLHLLRRLDVAVAMRFHAAIFALSQSLPTLGVDYYPGDGGKVEQLFADLGRAEDATRIDRFTADWLVRKLSEKIESDQAKAG